MLLLPALMPVWGTEMTDEQRNDLVPVMAIQTIHRAEPATREVIVWLPRVVAERGGWEIVPDVRADDVLAFEMEEAA